jgi:hypothetical protein
MFMDSSRSRDAVLNRSLGQSYVVEISITKQSSSTRNHRPQALPPSLLRLRNAASMFDIPFVGVILGLNRRSHDDVVRIRNEEPIGQEVA